MCCTAVKVSFFMLSVCLSYFMVSVFWCVKIVVVIIIIIGGFFCFFFTAAHPIAPQRQMKFCLPTYMPLLDNSSGWSAADWAAMEKMEKGKESHFPHPPKLQGKDWWEQCYLLDSIAASSPKQREKAATQ